MKNKFILIMVLTALSLLISRLDASVTYSFYCISDSSDINATNVATGEEQLFVTVSDPGTTGTVILGDGSVVDVDQVLFTFANTGDPSDPLDACFISDIYFYDGVLLSIAEITDFSTGVSFTEDATDPVIPPALPGDTVFKLVYGVSVLDSADADSNGTLKDGIDPGEYLSILFDLTIGSTYEDVLLGLDNHTIVIGLHVQGFDPDGLDQSGSFINNGVIPAPGAVLLGGIGIGLVGWLRRRRTI